MPKPEIDIYPKSRAPLDWALFENPTAEYRGAPFWSWNNRLDKGQLLRQVDMLRDMGFGGFHIHVRTGLETPYLGDEFMDCVRACMEKARDASMLCWLYDEDRWPSGFAGGIVTRDPQHRARHLLFSSKEYGAAPADTVDPHHSMAVRSGAGCTLARYEVTLKDGALSTYRRLSDGETPSGEGTLWHACLETAAPVSWYNNQTYVDTLSRPAIERFLAVTHERYREIVGGEFGKTVPAIFTDEPQFSPKRSLDRAEDTNDLFMPWTDDLPGTYAATYGQDLLEHLPELFWELPGGGASLVRYRYHDHVCERFTEAFADTIGAWCSSHGLALTGHMLFEESLGLQTSALGEAMRSYRSFHVPGIDMLCDHREYSTAKQAQSAAHQYGRSGVLSELYGVTNWDFDFVGHKAQGDWQAALGVTLRVPHLTWVSMAGEAKRDYPASIGYQSPWYEEYPLVEDHFGRLNAILTRGEPRVRVGVIHPIESYWLAFGPREQTALEREERETAFQGVIEWLLFGLVDFDFIAESLLPSLNPTQSGDRFRAGEMAYETVIVPAMRTIRATTLDRLEAFSDAGGHIVFAGEVPSLVDSQPSGRAQALAERCQRIELSRPSLLRAVDGNRDVEVRLRDGAPADSLLHQVREEGERRFVFLCNTDRKRPRTDTEVRFPGEWAITGLDTFTGGRTRLPATYGDGRTALRWTFPAHGHVLLMLEPGRGAGVEETTEPSWTPVERLSDPVPVTLSEPNVLLLDQAEYRLDGGEWRPREELLRLENAARAHFGLPAKSGAIAQPWTDTEPAPVLGALELRFTVKSRVDVAGPLLALEAPETVDINWDGAPVPSGAEDVTGWWVDESIRTVRLPAITPGTHELVLSLPFTRKSNVEWCYILGDFGVELHGRHAALIPPIRELAFGDWTRQGLPFYAGNVTYHSTIEGRDGDLAIRAPKFKAPLLSVDLDGNTIGKIAFAPFRVPLGRLSEGPHRLDITAYGNRFNAFGQLHHAGEIRWAGPDAWRSEGDDWCYEYLVRPMGVLVAPTVETA